MLMLLELAPLPISRLHGQLVVLVFEYAQLSLQVTNLGRQRRIITGHLLQGLALFVLNVLVAYNV